MEECQEEVLDVYSTWLHKLAVIKELMLSCIAVMM